MKFFWFLLLAIIILFTVVSCATVQKIDALKPEPDDANPIVYENETSFINLPVTIQLKDIENQTNKLLHGIVYEDTNLEDNNMAITVWKLAPIKIEFDNGKIKTILPLKANIKYRYGTSALGLELYDTREFNLNGVVTLISDVGLTNWQLKTNTALKDLNWNESPTISIAGKNIAITYLVNPAIRLFKSKIEKNIDEAIKKSLDFKPNVLDALDRLATPFQMSEAYESWFRLVPIELYTTEAKLSKDQITMNMGLKCSMETIIGTTPEKKFHRDKIVLKPVTKMPDRITANIIGVSTYSDASKIISKNFTGQEFGSGSKKVKVHQVTLWHKKGKMIIALDLSGSVNGTIYLSGFPQYNLATKEVYFDQLDYVLNTKSVLMKTANWLAQGMVLNRIRENCRYSIQPNLEEGKKNVMHYLTNYSPMKGVYINGSLQDFEFEKIELTNKAILAFIKTTGTINVKVDGLE